MNKTFLLFYSPKPGNHVYIHTYIHTYIYTYSLNVVQDFRSDSSFYCRIYSAPLRVERFLKSIHRKDIEFTYIHTYILYWNSLQQGFSVTIT